jgi:hypothetical protein
MHEDARLALDLAAARPAALVVFRERHAAPLAGALAAARFETAAGLTAEIFAAAVGRAAAESYLTAMADAGLDAALDPYVERALAEPELPLAILLARGSEAAWEELSRRHGGFLRELFERGGRSALEAGTLAEEVIDELRGTAHPQAPPPISRYRGTAPLRAWIYAFVRETFGREAGSVLTRTSAFPILGEWAQDASEQAAVHELPGLRDDLAATTKRALDELDPEAALIVRSTAAGIRPPDARAGWIEQRERAIEHLWNALLTRLLARGGRRLEIERRLQSMVSGDQRESLRGIRGLLT